MRGQLPSAGVSGRGSSAAGPWPGMTRGIWGDGRALHREPTGSRFPGIWARTATGPSVDGGRLLVPATDGAERNTLKHRRQAASARRELGVGRGSRAGIVAEAAAGRRPPTRLKGEVRVDLLCVSSGDEQDDEALFRRRGDGRARQGVQAGPESCGGWGTVLLLSAEDAIREDLCARAVARAGRSARIPADLFHPGEPRVTGGDRRCCPLKLRGKLRSSPGGGRGIGGETFARRARAQPGWYCPRSPARNPPRRCAASAEEIRRGAPPHGLTRRRRADVARWCGEGTAPSTLLVNNAGHLRAGGSGSGGTSDEWLAHVRGETVLGPRTCAAVRSRHRSWPRRGGRARIVNVRVRLGVPTARTKGRKRDCVPWRAKGGREPLLRGASAASLAPAECVRVLPSRPGLVANVDDPPGSPDDAAGGTPPEMRTANSCTRLANGRVRQARGALPSTPEHDPPEQLARGRMDRDPRETNPETWSRLPALRGFRLIGLKPVTTRSRPRSTRPSATSDGKPAPIILDRLAAG